MARASRRAGKLTSCGLPILLLVHAVSGAAPVAEDYRPEPLPAGFQVVGSELEGPVFADADGRTLYRWPTHQLRNGPAGDRRGKATCDDTRYTATAGLMSPYPPGLLLPERETRPSCVQAWPPVLAAPDSRPVGKWSVLHRADGRGQWAYDGFAVYTSSLDQQPGDVNGGSKRKIRGDSPAEREPVGPASLVPSQFAVVAQASGRLLVTHTGAAVYALAGERIGALTCQADCVRDWSPVLAPALARAEGSFTLFERSAGERQWAFRGEPLYTRVLDERAHSLAGADVPGWHNVYTQQAPAAPADFTVQDSPGGQVLADAHGRTVYVYHCGDDAQDQLACDHPRAPQAYRLAVCGGGDAARCLQAFPYVPAAAGAKPQGRVWSVLAIDPRTGKLAAPGLADALHVWAYRARPVFTCALDQAPGDVRADGWGEYNGLRNGFKAFWLRDEFTDNAG